MRLPGKVESVFTVANRGTVIVPLWLSDSKVRDGYAVQLRNPNNQPRNTRILSVEFLKGEGKSCRAAFLFPTDIYKDEIEVGAEIWIEDAPAK
jgi:hypothetical protein